MIYVSSGGVVVVVVEDVVEIVSVRFSLLKLVVFVFHRRNYQCSFFVVEIGVARFSSSKLSLSFALWVVRFHRCCFGGQLFFFCRCCCCLFVVDC
jgi:hypothetical protein